MENWGNCTVEFGNAKLYFFADHKAVIRSDFQLAVISCGIGLTVYRLLTTGCNVAPRSKKVICRVIIPKKNDRLDVKLE